MRESELRSGFEELDRLAQEEYGESLAQVARDGNDEVRLARLGRLVGVLLKEPFATPEILSTPSLYTGAHRAWELKPQGALQESVLHSTWQYQALEALRTDDEVVKSLGWQPRSVYELAEDAHHERGFFGYLAVSCRRYLCRDPKLRKEIEEQLEAEQRRGIDIRNVTPDMVVGSGGLAIGTALVQQIPVLGIMGAPVIAGVIFIIYSIGVNAFCSWAEDRHLQTADKEK